MEGPDDQIRLGVDNGGTGALKPEGSVTVASERWNRTIRRQG
jgi:hypothetical protein